MSSLPSNYNRFYDSVFELCHPNCYNLVLHKHLGDVFYAIGAKHEFEDTYNTKLHFIIRPQHEFLMKMYGITDYSIIDISKYEKEIINFRFPYLLPAAHKSHPFDVMCKDLFQSIPVKGLPFIVDSDLSAFHLFDGFWSHLWPYNLGLDMDNFRYAIPKHKLNLSVEAQQTLKKIAPLDKIVLFAPEAATATEFGPTFWNIIAKRVHKHGYKIIVNSDKFKIKHGISAFKLGLSLQDVVALGLSCAYVFSLRSGLCDVLVGVRERLYAFYPAMLHREMNGLNKCFEPKSNVNEIAVWQWKIDKVLWEGENITKPLQKYVNKLHYQSVIAKIKYILTLPLRRHRHGHQFCYRLLQDLAGRSRIFQENNKENPSHKYDDREISLFGLPIYSRECETVRHGRHTIKYKILGGLVQLRRFNDKEGLRLWILALPVFSRGKGKNKLFGINVHKYDFVKKWLDKVQAQIDKKYDDIYILRHNIGESYVELMHLSDAVKANKSKKPLLILWNKKYAGFYNMFLPKNMDMQFIDSAQSTIHTIFEKDTVINHNGQRFICATPLIIQNMKKLLPTWPDINFYDYINKAAGIKKGANPMLPKPSAEAKRKVASKVKQIELEDNFVILCPEANTLVRLENEFWEKLAKGLRKKGYDIFVNSYDKDMTLKGAKNARMTIEEMFVLAKRSKGIITLGSGMSVFLTAAGVKMDLLYTRFGAKNIEYDPALIIQIYSVYHLPGVSQSLVKEHDVSKIKEGELLNTLLKRY